MLIASRKKIAHENPFVILASLHVKINIMCIHTTCKLNK